jgi:hypothetical protein
MNWFYLITVILSVALSLICLYAATSANKKLNRLRKRYDYLLHGRGDMSIEDLIVKMNEEIDQLRADKAKSDQILNELSAWVGGEEDEPNLFEQRLAAINGDVQDQITGLKNRTAASMKRLDEQVYAQMDDTQRQMVAFTQQNIQDMHDQVDAFQGELSVRMKRIEEDNYSQMEELSRHIDIKDQEMSQMVKEMVKQMDTQIHETESRLTQDATAMNHSLTDMTQTTRVEVLTRLDENEMETREALTTTQEEVQRKLATTTNQLNQQMKTFSEDLAYNLSFALQRVSLYRYNAFAGLSGEQSFSAALLNERGDGFIISSIYSRQGSSTFAKLVENKKPLQDLSPEEAIALKQALNSKN